MNAGSGFATVAHGAPNRGATNEIAANEDAGNTGHLIFVDYHTAPFVDLDFVGVTGGENRNEQNTGTRLCFKIVTA